MGRLPPRILQNWSGDVAVWDPEVLAALGAMGLMSIATIVATFVLVRRKASFI